MTTNPPSNQGYAGELDVTTDTDEYNALAFLINQIVNQKWTVTLCKVMAVNGGGADGAPATVDAQPMVNQTDGFGNATPHGTIYGLPVFRLQGGLNALVIDPAVGDIGMMATASRDISSVKNTQKVSNPGSNRKYDPADGLYLGGFLNGIPSRYLQVTDSAIALVFSPTVKIELSSTGIVATFGGYTVTFSVESGLVIDAPVTFLQMVGAVVGGGGTVDLGAANIQTTGTATAADAVIGGKDFNEHVHGGVQPGPADTTPPV